MVQLLAYGDESGIQKDAPYCVVTGFIASARHWDLFSKSWRTVLAEYGVPAFHSKDFFQRARWPHLEHYRGWTGAKAEQFIERLLSVVGVHRLYPIGGAVDTAAFGELPQVERRFLTGGSFALLTGGGHAAIRRHHIGVDAPYFVGFNLLMIEAVQRAQPGSKVDFVFSQQDAYEGSALELFRETLKRGHLKGMGGEKLGNITYANPSQVEPLQLADLHAYVWNGYLTRRGRVSYDRMRVLEEMSRKRNSVRIFNAEAFRMILAQLDKELGAQLEKEGIQIESEPS